VLATGLFETRARKPVPYTFKLPFAQAHREKLSPDVYESRKCCV